MTSFQEKIICIWKKLYERKSATSFDENPGIKCSTCDGYRTECKQYLNKTYIENKKRQAKEAKIKYIK